VLFAVIWFMTLLIILPIRLETQGDRGNVVPGTHSGSPADPQMKKRFIITTIVAAVLWVIIAGVIVFGGLTVQDFDVFNRMG
ncbi:MAG: DUF1467 family protein, partial [Pseudomonadota bacterium]